MKLSNCCGGNLIINKSSESTQYYSCSTCNNACDEEQSEQRINTITIEQIKLRWPELNKEQINYILSKLEEQNNNGYYLAVMWEEAKYFMKEIV